MTLPPPAGQSPTEGPRYGEYSAATTWDAPPPPPAAPKKTRILPIVLGLGISFSIIIAGATTAYLQRDNIRDLLTVWSYEPTAVVEGYIERSQMTDRGEFLFKASQPVVAGSAEFNETCGTLEEGTGVLGCYIPSSRLIFLFDVTDDRLDGVEEVVASHEMLHAAWDRMGSDEQKRIGVLLEKVAAGYADDEDFSERMAVYARAEPGERLNELHSILGTEYADLGAELEKHYAEFFTDRAALVELHVASNAVLKDIDERTTALVAELDALYEEVESDNDRYVAGYDKLDKDVAAFNAKNNAYGFSNQAEFDAERNALIARQNKLDKLYASIIKRDKIYKTKSAELEELNAQAASLNKELNIVERESEF